MRVGLGDSAINVCSADTLGLLKAPCGPMLPPPLGLILDTFAPMGAHFRYTLEQFWARASKALRDASCAEPQTCTAWPQHHSRHAETNRAGSLVLGPPEPRPPTAATIGHAFGLGIASIWRERRTMQYARRCHNIIPGTPKPKEPGLWFWGRPNPAPRRQLGFESISGLPEGGAVDRAPATATSVGTARTALWSP